LPGDGLTKLERRYKEDIAWLFSLRRFGGRRDLKHFRRLLERIGSPQDDFKSIHITGTSGKGSTTAMAASILRAAGYRVGMFTSPHLSTFTERIQVGGEQIPVWDVVRLIDKIRPIAEGMAGEPELRHPQFFEMVTAMGFKYFSEKGVDFAVLEAGMGGKLDPTNVVRPLVSVITNVSLEHTDVLGNTVLEIAENKAGIIKEGGTLITATSDDDVYRLFRETCERVGSRIYRVGEDIRFQKLGSSYVGQRFRLDGLSQTFEELTIPLMGDFQLLNAACAIGAVEALRFYGTEVAVDSVVRGLSEVSWPGRLEVMERRPLVVLDGAKDVEAFRALKEALLTDFKYERLVAVVSISSEKKIPEMIEQLAQVADRFVLTVHGVMGRAADPSSMGREVERFSKPYEVVEDVGRAVERAKDLAGEDGMVIITGSVFLVGEAREIWHRPSHTYYRLER
jgi:dihydrofolate synthase/folylpolyglutamate synthase